MEIPFSFGFLATQSKEIQWLLSVFSGIIFSLIGFIRNEPFDPKTWIIPGDKSRSFKLGETVSKGTKIYTRGNRKLKRKVVADVVEALVGAFLSAGGEMDALLFMDWVGIKVDFNVTPYERQLNACPGNLVIFRFLESLLKYSFMDRSLLVEAMTHGSYMLPYLPRCYQQDINDDVENDDIDEEFQKEDVDDEFLEDIVGDEFQDDEIQEDDIGDEFQMEDLDDEFQDQLE